MDEYALQQLDGSARRPEIYRLRADVWSMTNGMCSSAFPDGVWRDPVDEDARHWIITDSSDYIVAAARLSLHETLDEVTEPFQYQRYGVGRRRAAATPHVQTIRQASG
jgi:hypothetical protein